MVFAPSLVAAIAVATFQPFALAVLGADIIGDLGISRQQLGLAVTANTIVAAVLSPVIGGVTDRLGARTATILVLLTGAAGLAATGAAGGYGVLIIASAFAGVSQAGGNPATNKLISIHVPPGRRGVVTGVKQSGVQVGVSLAGLTLPVLAASLDWRGAILTTAAVAGALVVPALWLAPDPVDPPVARSAAPDRRIPASIWLLTGYGTLLGLAAGATTIYIPLYAREVFGMSSEAAGGLVTVMGLAGVVARLWWGRVAEATLGPRPSLVVIAVLAAGAGTVLALAPDLGPWTLWPAVLLVAASVSAWNAVGMLTVIQDVGSHMTGRASGVVLLGFLAGLGSGAPAMGRSVDVSGSYRLGWFGVAAVSLLALPFVVGRLRGGREMMCDNRPSAPGES